MYDPKSFRLDDQVALVTGAAADIGRANAETFAVVGAAVMVSDLDLDAANDVVGSIESAGGKAAGRSSSARLPQAGSAARS